MKFSIITVVYNNINFIESNLNSIHSQSFKDIQHIIIDGGSTDGTAEYLKSDHGFPIQLLSEPDNGIYDAMNKGISIAGGDIIGILNSDDIYAADTILEKVINVIENNNADSVYGDLEYVDSSLNKTVRAWKSGKYHAGIMQSGWMPPHPTFFVKKSVYEKYGNFDTNYEISADYEFMLRVLNKNNISTHYIPEVFVKMRAGGQSYKAGNYIKKFREDLRAMNKNNIKHPYFCLLRKNISKLPQFL